MFKLKDTNLPEFLGVADTSNPPCNAGEVGGVRTSSIMPVSAYHPCTSSDELKVLLAPLPLSIPGETHRALISYEHATSECLADDLYVGSTGDTGYGWGVPVMPGFATLEAYNADPADMAEPVLGHVLPDGADGIHSGAVCPHVGAYISAPTELSYKAAMDPSNPERDQWMLAMKDEIESLRPHGTWVLTSVPSRQRVLSSRWLFVEKMGASGLVERFKARFVVQGFLQRPGVDFSEVYAPVLSKAGLRVLLSAITHRKMFVRQLDIKTLKNLSRRRRSSTDDHIWRAWKLLVALGIVREWVRAEHSIRV